MTLLFTGTSGIVVVVVLSGPTVWRVAVTGHRPGRLGGHDPQHPVREAVWSALCAELRGRLSVPGRELRAITGMALGVDQDFALACVQLGVPFTAAVPCAGQDDRWPSEARHRYRELLAEAAKVVVVTPGLYSPRVMQRRNAWMVRHADELLAVWDGSSGGTAHCVAEAGRRGVPVTRVDPRLLSRRAASD